MKQTTGVLLCILALSGCATTIRSDITVFHEMPSDISGKTYAVFPTEEQENSLEYKTYETIVKTHLNKLGLHEAPVLEAEMVVRFDYGIDSGRDVISSSPVFGKTGYSSATSRGTVYSHGNQASFSSTTEYTPTFGVVGTQVTQRTVYTRVFSLYICKPQPGTHRLQTIYEAEILSEGSSDQLCSVLPTMIETLFMDFPGESGTTKTKHAPRVKQTTEE